MTLFVGLAFALGFAALVPQVVRVLAADHDGVSTSTWLLVAVVNTSWATFFVMRDESMVAIGDVVLALGSLVVAYLSSAHRKRVVFVAAAAIGATFLIHAASPVAAAVVTGVVCAAMFMPQTVLAVGAIRGRRHLHGVSVSAWALNVAVAALWVFGGAQLGSIEVVAANLVLAACSVVVVVAAHHRRPPVLAMS